ncbi:hypothetical protein HWV62_42249 [Athelia sp. TMB]|nr:hypothetical protein HWV62_42249 [Athelia sp. TMB]
MNDVFLWIYAVPELQPDPKSSQELPSVLPDALSPTHVLALPRRSDKFVFRGKPLSPAKVTAQEVHFALCTGSGIYHLTIPNDSETPPSISKSFTFEKNTVGGICLGFGRALVHRNDCSGSAISYSLLGDNGESTSSIRPCVLTKKYDGLFAGYLMNEATGRVLQLVEGGRVTASVTVKD